MTDHQPTGDEVRALAGDGMDVNSREAAYFTRALSAESRLEVAEASLATLSAKLEEAEGAYDEAAKERDAAGFLGTVGDCIRYLSAGRDAAEASLANLVTMTGCRDLADVEDMANVGKSLMDAIELNTRDGPLKGWSPADDPAEIVVDLLNKLTDSEASLAAVMGEPEPIETAPRDGTMVWLLVNYSGPDADHPLADALRVWTLGFNNSDNDGEDAWRFAGWSWQQDVFTQGYGLPTAWKPVGFGLEVE